MKSTISEEELRMYKQERKKNPQQYLAVNCDIYQKNYVFKNYDLKIFSRQKILSTHMKVHHSGQFSIKYSCNVCDKGFLSNDKLKAHKLAIHGILPKKYPCDFCDKSFLSIKSAEIHQKEIHGILSNNYGCDICYQSFLSAAILEEHKKTIHGFSSELEQVSCKFCVLIFSDIESLGRAQKNSHRFSNLNL